MIITLELIESLEIYSLMISFSPNLIFEVKSKELNEIK